MLLVVGLTARLAGGSWTEALVLGAAAAAAAGISRRIRSAPEMRALAIGEDITFLDAVAAVVAVLVVDDVVGGSPDTRVVLAAVAGAAALVRATLMLLGRVGSWTLPRALIVGSGETGTEIAHTLSHRRALRIVGFADDVEPGASRAQPVLGSLADVPLLVERHGVQAVVFAFSAVRDRRLVDVMAACRRQGVAVFLLPRLFEELDRRVVHRRVAGLQLLAVDPKLVERPLLRVGRLVDVAMSLVLLVLSAPLWVLISAAIVIDSRGGIFYRAPRVGLAGRPFRMLKFRKMEAGSAGPPLTRAGDPRLTRLGAFLAASKLDELPQLLHVLSGEMTLVGPRPEDPAFVEAFPDAYAEILSVRPGVTGLTQIQFRNEAKLLLEPDFEERYRTELLPEKIAIDRYYVAHRSLLLDVRILLWTGVAIVSGVRLARAPLTHGVEFVREPTAK